MLSEKGPKRTIITTLTVRFQRRETWLQ